MNQFTHNTWRILFCAIVLSGTFSCQKLTDENTRQAEKESMSLRIGGNVGVDLRLVASGFTSPVQLIEAPDESHRLFVVDQDGQVWIMHTNGTILPQPFIDISNRLVTLNPGFDERGLLGLAFHPDFIHNRKFYLFYTAPPPFGGPTVDAGNTGLPMTWNNMTVISEFQASSGNPDIADPNSERKILEEPHPQFNHNGGTVAFGGDGYLYISIGDGGNKNDIGPGHVEDWYPFNAGGNGQDITSNLMGNILRIDINSSMAGKNYAIPPDNPFVGKEGLDEIWAYGLRNPYRFSFDMKKMDRMVLGDAGQNQYEEIDVVTKGGNYGWNVKEATECFNAANELGDVADCPNTDIYGNHLIDPVIETNNLANPEGGNFAVIIGGYVYRGNDLPGMQGKYLFANATASFATLAGEVYVSQPKSKGTWDFQKISFKSYPDNIGHIIKGFGQDMSGEVYVLASGMLGPTGNVGKVFKIVRAD